MERVWSTVGVRHSGYSETVINFFLNGAGHVYYIKTGVSTVV